MFSQKIFGCWNVMRLKIRQMLHGSSQNFQTRACISFTSKKNSLLVNGAYNAVRI